MAANGPRIMAYCYSEGPVGGQGLSTATGPDANATLAVIEQGTPGTTTYARPLVPELFTTQLTTIGSSWSVAAPQGAPAGTYTVLYSASTQRITILSTNVVAHRPVMVGNMALWCGLTQDLSSGWAASWEGASRPAGIAELIGVTVEPAEDAARVDLARYRHGRAVASVWGNHQRHRVQLVFSAATKAQIEIGFLTTGRVRIWQFGDGGAYSPTNVDGYIDGWVVAASDPTEDGDVGELWTLDLVLAVAR